MSLVESFREAGQELIQRLPHPNLRWGIRAVELLTGGSLLASALPAFAQEIPVQRENLSPVRLSRANAVGYYIHGIDVFMPCPDGTFSFEIPNPSSADYGFEVVGQAMRYTQQNGKEGKKNPNNIYVYAGYPNGTYEATERVLCLAQNGSTITTMDVTYGFTLTD